MVRGRHICPDVVVEMQGIKLQQSFHVFDMGGTGLGDRVAKVLRRGEGQLGPTDDEVNTWKGEMMQ